MISKKQQSAQTKKTQNKALSGGVSVGWREVKLGDLVDDGFCVIKNNLRKPLSSATRSEMQGKYPYYGAAGQIDSINDYKLEGFHLLIAEDGTVTSDGIKPMLQLVSGKFWVSNHAHILQGKTKKDTRLLYYMLNTVNINTYITGAVQPKLSKENLLRIKLDFPPLPEQKAIAEVLSSLDDKIDLLHRQNKTLENMAQALFRKWFIDETDEGWEIGKLSDIVDVSSGKGLKKDEYIVNGKYSVLGANGKIGRTNKYLLDEKVIFTGRVGTLGNVFIFDGKVWLSDNTLIIKPKAKHFYFVYFLLKTKNLKEMNVGSTQPLIRQSDLKNIAVFLPPKNILQDFENKMGDFFVKIDNNQSQICTLENLRDTLLPKLMSGEVRVKDFTK